jgi:amino acid permease
MTRATRTIILLVMIEICLAIGWLYLANVADTSHAASRDAGRVIGRTMGTVMGVVLGLAPFLYLLARSNDRKAAARRQGD